MHRMLVEANAADIPMRREDWAAHGAGITLFPGVAGWFDAASATWSDGSAPLVGYALWRPGMDDRPAVRGAARRTRTGLRLDREPAPYAAPS